MNFLQTLAENFTLETKQSQSIPVVVSAIDDRQTETGLERIEDDEALLYIYQQCVWAYVAVSSVASSVAQVPLKVTRKLLRGKKNRDVTDDPRVQFLQFPNQHMSPYRFWEATVSFLALTGDAFWEVYPNRTNPQNVFIMRPDYVRVIPDKKNLVKGYVFDPGGVSTSESVTLDVDQVVHFKTFNPLTPFEGQSPLSAAKLSVTADLLSQKYNNAFFSNQARPDGIFTTGQTLTDASHRRLEHKLITLRKGFRNNNGGANFHTAFSPLILDGGLDFKPVSLGPKDIEFAEGRAGNRQDILSTLRVTPTIAGLPSANFAESRNEVLVYRHNTIIPLLKALESDLTSKLLRFIDSTLSAYFDIEDIPGFAEDESERQERIRKNFVSGLLTLDQALKQLRLPEIGGELGNRRYMPSNFIEITNATSGTQPDQPKKDMIDSLSYLETLIDQMAAV
jgi:HK97 family phage portal protein